MAQDVRATVPKCDMGALTACFLERVLYDHSRNSSGSYGQLGVQRNTPRCSFSFLRLRLLCSAIGSVIQLQGCIKGFPSRLRADLYPTPHRTWP